MSHRRAAKLALGNRLYPQQFGPKCAYLTRLHVTSAVAAALTNSLGYLATDSAVAAVVRESPETRQLIEEFRATQRRLFELREAMREISRHHGALPEDAKSWDAVNWDQSFARSDTAALVKAWIERLKIDAEATLRFRRTGSR
jgi:hypothetical protein